MSFLCISSDKHFLSKEPFYSALKDYSEWFNSQDFNNEENYYLDLGDIFDESLPDPKTNELVLDYFSKMKFKKIFILQGNHEYSGLRKQSALQILYKYSNIEIIDFLKVLDIENLHCLCLPYFYPSQHDKSIFEVYNNLPKDIIDDEFDFIFSHIEDETQNFGNKFINLSKLRGKRIQGHIHIPSENYLGVPVISRYDERGIKNKIAIVDLDTKKLDYIEVPKLLDYVDINYPDDLINKAKYNIYTIQNAPSRDSVREFYSKKYKDKILYFRDFKIKKDEEEIIEIINEDNKSEKDLFIDFCNIKKIENDIQNVCMNYLN